MQVVQVFRKLESEDLRVLQVIEAALSKHEFVPKRLILKFPESSSKDTSFRLKRLSKYRLIRSIKGAYVGYALNYAGYDCLAINALVKAGVLEALGTLLGVGKESDVYDALNPEGERIAVKFHRLGRISFRQTIRNRGYTTEHVSWLFQSRIAAEKEYRALKLAFPHEVAVPKPISWNRHIVAMGMIEGTELAEHGKIQEPKKVLQEILLNLQKAYLRANIIHADLSEYNIILNSDTHILIIDWPQYVSGDHPNAEELLTRDITNILQFFKRKHLLKLGLDGVKAFVKGKRKLTM